MFKSIVRIKNNLEEFKNKSPEKFLLCLILSVLVLLLWGYIIFFLPDENNLNFEEFKRENKDMQRQNLNFANDDKNDKIDSKATNREVNHSTDNQLRKSPFAYYNEVDSRVEEVFVYQNDKVKGEKEQEELKSNDLLLTGIIITENDNLAVIKEDELNNYYRSQDYLAQYLIDEINSNYLVVKDELENEYRLKFED